MAIQQEKGSKGEKLAAKYLQEKGYIILERNYRSGRSEIDIIASINKVLVFVEVKFRTGIEFGYPEEFVGKSKAAKVIEGADRYIEANAHEGQIRFDIISIIMNNEEIEIEHFKDAFY